MCKRFNIHVYYCKTYIKQIKVVRYGVQFCVAYKDVKKD